MINIPLILSTAVFELKADILKKEDADQLVEYIEWASRLIPGSNLDMIHGVLVGREFGSKQKNRKESLLNRIKEGEKMYKIKAYEYIIDNVEKTVAFKKISE